MNICQNGLHDSFKKLSELGLLFYLSKHSQLFSNPPPLSGDYEAALPGALRLAGGQPNKVGSCLYES